MGTSINISGSGTLSPTEIATLKSEVKAELKAEIVAGASTEGDTLEEIEDELENANTVIITGIEATQDFNNA